MEDFHFKFIEKDFHTFYDELYKFCKLAEAETTLEKTKRNMKGHTWKNYPESLLYRLYKSEKYDNGNGAISLLYDNEGICAFGGVEKHTNNIAIMAKRYYVKRKYRFTPILSSFIIQPQIDWAKRKGFKVCLMTINEYQRSTVLQLFKRAQKRQAIVLGKQVYPNGNIYSDMSIIPCKVYINGEYQYIIVHKIDKNYNLDLEEI
jgi:hypothetical protein